MLAWDIFGYWINASWSCFWVTFQLKLQTDWVVKQLGLATPIQDMCAQCARYCAPGIGLSFNCRDPQPQGSTSASTVWILSWAEFKPFMMCHILSSLSLDSYAIFNLSLCSCVLWLFGLKPWSFAILFVWVWTLIHFHVSCSLEFEPWFIHVMFSLEFESWFMWHVCTFKFIHVSCSLEFESWFMCVSVWNLKGTWLAAGF